MYTYTCIFFHARHMYVCIHMYMHVFSTPKTVAFGGGEMGQARGMYACIHTRAYFSMHVIYVFVYTCTHVYIYIYIYTHIYASMYTDTYTKRRAQE